MVEGNRIRFSEAVEIGGRHGRMDSILTARDWIKSLQTQIAQHEETQRWGNPGEEAGRLVTHPRWSGVISGRQLVQLSGRVLDS